MDVEHGLTGGGVTVEHRAVSAFGESALGGDCSRTADHRTHEGIVAALDVVHRRDVFARNDEDVHRRLRIDVVEGDKAVVFIDFRRWNLT